MNSGGSTGNAPSGMFDRKPSKFPPGNFKIPSFHTQNTNLLLDNESFVRIERVFDRLFTKRCFFFVIVVLFAVCSFHAASGRFLICAVKRNERQRERARHELIYHFLATTTTWSYSRSEPLFFLSGDLNISRVE